MKKRIHKMMVLVAAAATLLTIYLITIVYYDIFSSQVKDDLKVHALLVQTLTKGAGPEQDNGKLPQLQEVEEKLAGSGIRLTLIDSQGQVMHDSEADSGQMENHGSRPEIQEAMQDGEGWAVRTSQTLSRSTFYYAVRLENGGILRISKDAGSIFSMFRSALPGLLTVFGVMLVLCLVMAHFLTGKLIQPVEKLAENLDGEADENIYEELVPFFSMIQRQHQDIVKNARMRQEFTANVSHELKTPLTSISGYAELIEAGMASEEDVVRFAHGIRQNANRLLALINDILRLSELDGPGEEAVMEPINLHELADTCVEMLSLSAAKHGVTISIKGTETSIMGDRQMMEELLYNLCDNAIRYNNVGGKVEVLVYSSEHEKILEVRDTGIGIPKEHQKRIFERFYRVDKSRSKSTGGTGLGLAIVKHIVAKHNARMELESEEGRGTVIRVLFPDQPSSEGSPEPF